MKHRRRGAGTSGRAHSLLGSVGGRICIMAVSCLLPALRGSRAADVDLYIVPPISSVPILPGDAEIPGSRGNEISLAACRGEYEPGSFVVRSAADVASLRFDVSDLAGPQGLVPGSAVDIKVVKCWYQADGAWFDIHIFDRSKRVLVPELLLNDDTLLRVDHEARENYLKLSYPDGDKYEWISEARRDASGFEILSPEAFPVRDSPNLLPVDIPANVNKQFWVTVKVPESAAPGVYRGSITLVNKSAILGRLALNLRVLPFALAEPYYTSSIFYRGKLDPSGLGSVSSEHKSPAQLRAEFANMRAHGVTSPVVYQSLNDKKGLAAYLSIRNEAGLAGRSLYFASSDTDVLGRESVRAALDTVRPFGVTEVYFYGKDEAKGDLLTGQRAKWELLRKAGGRIFVAGYFENFAKMRDVQDVNIHARYPSREEAAKWHSVGGKIWCYSNPQVGAENPEVNRVNYGLLLWKNNYDGACNYAYQHSFGNIWNDFDGKHRDHNYTYPTVDGVIDTLAWEGYREGVDDVRYVTTLAKSIREAKESPDASTRATALDGERYLEALDVENRDPDTIRLEITDRILELADASREAAPPRVHPCYRLPDAPDVDGKLDDPAWQTVPEISAFERLSGQLVGRKQTYLRLGYTPAALFVGVECFEPDIEEILRAEDAAPPWRRDSVELFVLPAGSETYHQFGVTPSGDQWYSLWDARWQKKGLDSPDRTGQGAADGSAWEAAVSAAGDRWFLEARLPFAALGDVPDSGESWQGHVGRNMRRFSSRFGQVDYSSSAHVMGSYHYVDGFGAIVFRDAPPRPTEVQAIERELNAPLRAFYGQWLARSSAIEAELVEMRRNPRLKEEAERVLGRYRSLADQCADPAVLSLKQMNALFLAGKRLEFSAIDGLRKRRLVDRVVHQR